MLLANAEERDAGPSLSEHDIAPDRTRTGLCLPILASENCEVPRVASQASRFCEP